MSTKLAHDLAPLKINSGGHCKLLNFQAIYLNFSENEIGEELQRFPYADQRKCIARPV